MPFNSEMSQAIFVLAMIGTILLVSRKYFVQLFGYVKFKGTWTQKVLLVIAIALFVLGLFISP